MPEVNETISQLLFADAEKVFAVLDGAVTPEVVKHIYALQPEHVCLYAGELAPDMQEVAPYLVQLDPNAEFTIWLIEEGWGKNFGIYAQTQRDLHEMRKHFRSLLTVYDPQHEPLLFRYYDPRVLRLFLPTCEKHELATMFGAIDSFLLEAEDASKLLSFSRVDGALKSVENDLQAGRRG